MIAIGMLNDQLMVKWTGASGPVAVKTAMIGLKLAVINAPVMPKKKQAVVNHMIPKGSAVHGMMPPTVAVSRRSVICMLALKATASRTDPTMERVSVRHRLGKAIGGIGSKRPPRVATFSAGFMRAPFRDSRVVCALRAAGRGLDGCLQHRRVDGPLQEPPVPRGPEKGPSVDDDLAPGDGRDRHPH